MTRSRTPIEAAAGKLIAAIQKEWHIEAGEPGSAASENVMHAAHDLLSAASKFGSIASTVGTGSVSTFLGVQWVEAHPRVMPFIAVLEGLQRVTSGNRPGEDSRRRKLADSLLSESFVRSAKDR